MFAETQVIEPNIPDHAEEEIAGIVHVDDTVPLELLVLFLAKLLNLKQCWVILALFSAPLAQE